MSLEVQRHASPAGFLARALPFLETEEPLHTLPIGVATRLIDAAPDPAQDWLTVEEEGRVVGAVMRTPPHNPSLSRLSPAGVEAVVSHFAGRCVDLDGVFGPSEESERFARRWSEINGRPIRIRWRMLLSVCTALRSGAVLSHDLVVRAPIVADRERLASFVRCFHEEVQMPAPEDPLAAADRLIAQGTLRVCECAGRLTSCANIGRESRRGAAIALVYTPPEERGRGYATACVRELTRSQFAAGKEFCCLFTNAAEPVPNHIYQKLGYDVVAEFLWWEFLATDSGDASEAE